MLQGQAEGRHHGPRQKLQDWQIIASVVAQSLHASGILQHIIRRYFAVQLSSSASSQRRQQMQLEPFTTVMRHALRPMAQPQIHADCFFAGLRLPGIAQSSEEEEVRRAGAVRISLSLCQECVVALFMVLQASQGLMDASAQGELVRRV